MCIRGPSHFSSTCCRFHKFGKRLPLFHSTHSLFYKYTIFTVLYIRIHKITSDVFHKGLFQKQTVYVLALYSFIILIRLCIVESSVGSACMRSLILLHECIAVV